MVVKIDKAIVQRKVKCVQVQRILEAHSYALNKRIDKSLRHVTISNK